MKMKGAGMLVVSLRDVHTNRGGCLYGLWLWVVIKQPLLEFWHSDIFDILAATMEN